MSASLVGHLDPEFLTVMNQVQQPAQPCRR
jgi:hypothetical protein